MDYVDELFEEYIAKNLLPTEEVNIAAQEEEEEGQPDLPSAGTSIELPVPPRPSQRKNSVIRRFSQLFQRKN